MQRGEEELSVQGVNISFRGTQPSTIPGPSSMWSVEPSGAAQCRKRVKVCSGHHVAPFSFAGLRHPKESTLHLRLRHHGGTKKRKKKTYMRLKRFMDGG